MFKYLALLGAVAASDAGAAIAVTQEGLTEAKTIAVPYIFDAIKTINVDEVDFDGGYLKNIAVTVEQPPLEDITLSIVEGENGLEVAGSDLKINANCDFKYKYGFITADGTADIKIKNIGFDVKLDLSQQPGTPSYTIAPKVTAAKFDLDVNSDDVDIDLHGGFVTTIAKVLIPLIKSSVIPTVVDQIKSTATTVIDTTLDADLALYGTQAAMPFDENIVADYGMMNDSPQAANAMLTLEVNGTFFNKQNLSHGFTPSAFSDFDADGKNMQLHLTDYVLNTLFESAYIGNDKLELTQLLDLIKMPLTTDEVGVLIPEVLEHYGSGKTCSIFATGKEQESYQRFVEGGMSVTFPVVTLELTVEGETAIKGDFYATFSTDLTVADGTLTGGNFAADAKVDSVESTTMTDLDAAALNAIIAQNLPAAVDAVNAALTAGVKIPDDIEGINFSDASLDFKSGVVALGLTPTTSTWKMLGAALRGSK